MRPFVALSCLVAVACGAPTAQLAALPAGLPALHGLGYAGAVAAPAVAAPAAFGPEHYSAGPVVAHAPVAYAQPAAPAPFTTSSQAAGVTTVHQPEPIITKQVHLGQTNYVSGYATRILKPATPHLPIAVPTVLRGSHAVTAPIVKTQAEVHNVQTPVLVERKVDAPFDAPFYTEKIVEVPTPVHVDAPYNVPYPVAVQGEPIIKKTIAAPVVTHSHHVNAAPALAAAPAFAAAPVAARAVAAPAFAGFSGYAGFPALAHHQAVAAPAVVA